MLLPEVQQEVVKACRRLADGGLLRGTSGNVSSRERDGALMAITPSARPYPSLTPDEVAVVDIGSGRVVDGLYEPSSEVLLHLEVYRRRPEVTAIVHTHSTFATTFAVLGEPVPPVHYLLARAGAPLRVAPYEQYGTPALAAACASTLGEASAVLLANHGVVTVGADMDSAVAVAEAVESTAELAWRARAIGAPHELDEQQMSKAAKAFSHYGSSTRRAAPR